MSQARNQLLIEKFIMPEDETVVIVWDIFSMVVDERKKHPQYIPTSKVAPIIWKLWNDIDKATSPEFRFAKFPKDLNIYNIKFITDSIFEGKSVCWGDLIVFFATCIQCARRLAHQNLGEVEMLLPCYFGIKLDEYVREWIIDQGGWEKAIDIFLSSAKCQSDASLWATQRLNSLIFDTLKCLPIKLDPFDE
jgi:hypothetical protein